VFSHYLRLPTAYLDQQQSGASCSRSSPIISNWWRRQRTSAAISLISDSLTIPGIAHLPVLYEIGASRCSAIVLAPRYRLADENCEPHFPALQASAFQNSMGDITRVRQRKAIDAHRLIKIFNARGSSNETIRAGSNEHNRASNMKLGGAPGRSVTRWCSCIAAIALGSVLFVAIRQVFFPNDMKVDDFFAFLTALMLIPRRCAGLVNMSGPLQQGIAAGQSVFENPRSPDGRQRAAHWPSRGREARSSFAMCPLPMGGDKGDVCCAM